MSYRTNKIYLKAVSVIGEKLYKVYQKNLLKYEADIDEAAEKFFKLQIAYHDYILRNKDLELMIPFFTDEDKKQQKTAHRKRNHWIKTWKRKYVELD